MSWKKREGNKKVKHSFVFSTLLHELFINKYTRRAFTLNLSATRKRLKKTRKKRKVVSIVVSCPCRSSLSRQGKAGAYKRTHNTRYVPCRDFQSFSFLPSHFQLCTQAVFFFKNLTHTALHHIIIIASPSASPPNKNTTIFHSRVFLQHLWIFYFGWWYSSHPSFFFAATSTIATKCTYASL